ncbi:GEVED domain-containing protein [Aequorivita sp. KMM 9714]|uniref:GEVED domain-containing protein n=1 Tax=Aequorivita sp. KMM 9714 TaxID=2707173 RepID=UPI0013E9CBB7|nr:GEVED domain-containing protein [Aequorivita sp. KMM 9714]NGX83279.1 T9SS type A sorting domain-containing protein [Aequorivita sp. KMM 9714]
MMKKIPKYLCGSWLMSTMLFFGAVPTSEAQTDLSSSRANSSWTNFNERTNGVGEITVNGVDPSTFSFPNTSTAFYPRTQATVVYDNGPHVNVVGNPDLSVLESVTHGMNTLGGNVSNAAGFAYADDFELLAETEVTEITGYAYQTNATSTSINAMYVTIWDGNPSDASSTIVWGDQTTNVFSSVENINAYRVAENDQGGRARMIQKVNAAITGLTLSAGTYWLEYSFDGTGGSGPWQPPISILGETSTGDALQKTSTGWGPWLDTGLNTPQGVPFQIHGEQAGGAGCEWTVIVQGTSFGDEVEWELREAGGAVLLSGGGYGQGYYDEQTTTAEGPLEFYINSIGTFGDNTPAYTILTDGNEILDGVLPGGEEATFSDLNCDTGGGTITYCIPEGTNSSRFINNFSTTGGSDNVSNMASGYSADGYGDFYDTHTVAQEQGGDVEFTVDIEGGTAGFRVWVDWNQDGVFDTATEVAYNSSSYENSHSGSFTVPADALEGDTRMRIASHWLDPNGDVDPCETGFSYGEFEDYKFTVGTGTVGGGYCIPVLDCTDNDMITNVTFQEIDNTTTCSPDGYGDYTAMSGTVAAGGTYPISVSVGNGWSSESVSVWIDFDNSETFEESEFFYIGTGSDEALTGELAIPAGLADGDYRMRVRVAAVGQSTATWDMSCDETQGYGETEDYTITVDGTAGVNDFSAVNFSYFPNPMQNELNIASNLSIESISVYNLLGQEVMSNVNVSNGKVDVSALSTGTFLFRVTFEGGLTENFKVIKQ